MQTHQTKPHHLLPILLLNDRLISVQLQRIVPEVRVLQMPNARRQRLAPISIHLQNLLAPLPVIDQQRPVIILVDHVNRPRDLQFLVVNRPLRPIRMQVRILAQKVLKVAVLDAVVLDLHLIVVALNVVVHVGARRGRAVAVRVPHVQDLPRRHHVIFVLGVVLVLPTAQNLLDDLVRVELGEVVVVPRGDRRIRGVAVDRVDVGRLFELNKGIAIMGVFLC